MRTWRMKQLGNKMCCQICLCNHTTTVHSPQQTKVNLTDCGRNVAILGCALTSLPWHVAGWPPFISITCLVSVHVCVWVCVCSRQITSIWGFFLAQTAHCCCLCAGSHRFGKRVEERTWGVCIVVTCQASCVRASRLRSCCEPSEVTFHSQLRDPYSNTWAFMLRSSPHCLFYLSLSQSVSHTHTHTHSTLAFVVCERSQYVSIELSADAPLLRLVSMASFVTTDIQTVGTVWSKNIRRQMINMHGLTRTF